MKLKCRFLASKGAAFYIYIKAIFQNKERVDGKKVGYAQAISGQAFFCLVFLVTFVTKTKVTGPSGQEETT